MRSIYFNVQFTCIYSTYLMVFLVKHTYQMQIIIKFTFISIYSTYVHNKGNNIEHMYVHLLLPIRKLLSHNITHSYCAWAIIVLIWQTYKICCHGYIKLYSVQRYPQFTSCLIIWYLLIPQGLKNVHTIIWKSSKIFFFKWSLQLL